MAGACSLNPFDTRAWVRTTPRGNSSSIGTVLIPLIPGLGFERVIYEPAYEAWAVLIPLIPGLGFEQWAVKSGVAQVVLIPLIPGLGFEHNTCGNTSTVARLNPFDTRAWVRTLRDVPLDVLGLS